MLQETPEQKPPNALKILLLAVGTFSLLNLGTRFFGLSVIGPMAWYPDKFNSISQGEDLRSILAWIEFSMVAAALTVLCAALLAFIAIRECYWFFRDGGQARVVSNQSLFASAISILTLYYTLFHILPSGPEALQGTRASGFGLPVFMTLVGAFQTILLMVILAFALNPKHTQASLDQAQAQRKGEV